MLERSALPTPKAVLFDLDGTLLDTADDLGAALNYLLNKYGLPEVTRTAFRPIASDGAKGLLELGFGKLLGKYDYEQLRVQFLEYYRENIAAHTQLYSGIKEILAFCQNQQIAWGIVTNKPEDLTLKLLPHFNEFKQCQVVVAGDSLPERKPHPAPILHACQALSLRPEETWYIGDAPRDITSANSAKTLSVIAGWGYISDLSACSTWQANIFCRHSNELLTLLKNTQQALIES